MSAQLSSAFGIVRRYPYAAICILVTVLCGGASWWLWGQIGELEVARADRAKEGEAMLTLLVGGTAQRQELALAHEGARRIEDNLIVETNLAENTWYFFKFEEQTKVRLTEFHPISSPVADASSMFRRVPYTLRLAGTFSQVSAFLLALETGPRLINITSFAFARRDAGGAEIVLDLSLEILGKK